MKKMTALQIKESVNTKEDFEKLMSKLITKAFRKSAHSVKKSNDDACSNGSHGFNTKTWLGGGSMHTKCTNCGECWSNPDLPMTI